jgi:L-threonylcarbamoyladenylate synthase
MHIVRSEDLGHAPAAEYAARVVAEGGVVLFPTDTLYGLGADALSDEAVAKIYRIKGRDEGKPIHALVSSVEMAGEYGEVNGMVSMFMKQLPRGKVTYIVRKRKDLDTGILKGMRTFGFRIPDDEFCLHLVASFGKPITATSANASGLEPKRTVPEILAQLGVSAEGIALAVDGGEISPRKPSTVIDCTGKEPVLLREGAISAAEVWDAVRSEL